MGGYRLGRLRGDQPGGDAAAAAWQTVPFLAIWVSLTVIYGFRLWRIQPTILTLAAVTIATGGIIGVQVLKGQQDADYLAEVPLIALMILAT